VLVWHVQPIQNDRSQVFSANEHGVSMCVFVICRHCLGIGPAYRYQGCYNDEAGPYLGGDRTLPQTYGNFRSGVGIDECAAAACSRGFPVFAMQWKGQCFFGSMADVARLQSSQKLSDDKCSSLPCPESAATCPWRINKVYLLIGAGTCLQPFNPKCLYRTSGWLCVLSTQQSYYCYAAVLSMALDNVDVQGYKTMRI
jgi:hypothetical protein